MRDNDLCGSLVTGPRGSSNETFYQLAMKDHQNITNEIQNEIWLTWTLYNVKNKKEVSASAGAGGLMLPMWM